MLLCSAEPEGRRKQPWPVSTAVGRSEFTLGGSKEQLLLNGAASAGHPAKVRTPDSAFRSRVFDLHILVCVCTLQTQVPN
jgi:hypothetical protein